MSQLLKHWGLHALAALALITLLGNTSAAFASSGQSGESSHYTLENVGGPLVTRNNRAQARNGGNLLEVWRGADNNTVWLSLNNTAPFTTTAPTATTVAPAVTAWGDNDFMIVHTGTDGHIYYCFLFINNGQFGTTAWFSVPDQTTHLPVSVTQMGPGSGDVYMVYLSSNDDGLVWGTWYDAGTGEWSEADNINGGRGSSAPSVTYVPEVEGEENPIPLADRLIVTVVGTDNNIWTTGQFLGANSWTPWRPVLGQANGPFANQHLVNGSVAPGAAVHTAVNENSNGSQTFVMTVLDSNRNPEYATFDLGLPELSDGGNWTVDITGWQANETPNLTTNGNSTFSLFTGLDDLAYWKQEFHE